MNTAPCGPSRSTDISQLVATWRQRIRGRTRPQDAIVFGLKELPEDGTPLRHRHIMFGHAYKGQPAGRVLLDRFVAGGGTLYDLEYLVDANGRRVAAFGYWAGFAGAACDVSLLGGAAARLDWVGTSHRLRTKSALLKHDAQRLVGRPANHGPGDRGAWVGSEPAPQTSVMPSGSP